jgi:hypothetical protein
MPPRDRIGVHRSKERSGRRFAATAVRGRTPASSTLGRKAGPAAQELERIGIGARAVASHHGNSKVQVDVGGTALSDGHAARPRRASLVALTHEPVVIANERDPESA